MATDLRDGRAAVLAFTRELRRPISAREELMQKALHAYRPGRRRSLGPRHRVLSSRSASGLRVPSELAGVSLQGALKSFRERDR
jgi:hypothetical protein